MDALSRSCNWSLMSRCELRWNMSPHAPQPLNSQTCGFNRTLLTARACTSRIRFASWCAVLSCHAYASVLMVVLPRLRAEMARIDLRCWICTFCRRPARVGLRFTEIEVADSNAASLNGGSAYAAGSRPNNRSRRCSCVLLFGNTAGAAITFAATSLAV